MIKRWLGKTIRWTVACLLATALIGCSGSDGGDALVAGNSVTTPSRSQSTTALVGLKRGDKTNLAARVTDGSAGAYATES